MVKVNNAVSSKRRVARREHFNAPSHIRRIKMSTPLSKKLKEEHGAKAVPIRKGDEVKILKGKFKGVVGKVKKVVRLKYAIYVEGAQGEKSSGKTFEVPVNANHCQITKLYLDKDRKEILKRKQQAKQDKGKFTEATVQQQ
ncbi:hypothetical protein ABK040_003480 [Willaertia magna]